MSADLSVLGQELCREFDDRQRELKKLGFEVQVDIKKQCGDLYHQKRIDGLERQAEKLRLQTEVRTLLMSFGHERRTLRQMLGETQMAQTRELKSWLEESGDQLEAWQKAVLYIHSK